MLADPKQQDFQNNETLKTQISNELVKAVQNKLKQQTLHDFIHESNKPTRHTTFEKRSRTLALKRDADLKRTCFLVVGLADVCQTCLQAAAALARRPVSARFWTSGEPRGRSRQSAPFEQGEAGVVGSAGERNRQRSRAGASAGERSGAGAREMLAR